MNTRFLFKNCTFLMLLFLPLLITGCSTSDSDADCPATYVDLQIVPHWPDGATIPSGIRVLLYPHNEKTYVLVDLPANGGTISILTGTYSIVVLNNDSQKILFDSKDSYAKQNASTSTVNVSFPDHPEITKSFVSPDNLWHAAFDSYKITTKTTVLDVYPENKVYQFYVIVPMTGTEYISTALGVVSNLKESILLSNADVSPVKGSVLLGTTKNGTNVRFSFRSFGVVTQDSHEIVFTINTASRNYQFSYDITSALNAIPHGGTITLSPTEPIVIAPDAMGGEGGIEVGIDSWNNIIVPLPPIIARPV